MTNDIPSDTELMLRLSRKDMSALGELAKRHQERVLAIAFRTLGKWDLAEDIAQETFLRVHRAAGNYRPKAKFTTWLYRIVVNLCLDEKRRRSRIGASLEDVNLEAQAETEHDAAEKKELTELVARAVDQLTERQRVALVLHRYEGLSHSDIAEVTGWTMSAVESLLVRAYANLREKLSKMQYFVE